MVSCAGWSRWFAFVVVQSLMDCSPPDSAVHRVSQAGILEQVAMPSSRGTSRPRDRTHVSCTGRQITAESPERRSVQFSCSVVSDSATP